jgi:hypothetical protein
MPENPYQPPKEVGGRMSTRLIVLCAINALLFIVVVALYFALTR